jgi:outer membrane protein
MRISCILLALCALSLPAVAQDPPRSLTLDDAERIARESNPRYRKAHNNLETARAGERQRWAAFLPDLRLSLSSGGYLSRKYTGLDEFGKPVRRDDPIDYTGSSSSQSLYLGIPLFDGGQRYRELRAARAEAGATEAAALAEASALDAELARHYYDARRKAALIRLEEELLRAAEARHAATERLLRIASASPVDLLGAEIAIAQQARAVEQARGEARKAMLVLNEAMGLSEAVAWELRSDPPPVFDPASLDPDRLTSHALSASPRLRQLQAQVDVADHRRRAAGASRWPTLSASAGFGRSIGTVGYGALFDPNPLDQGFNFGLSVSIPISSQYQSSYQVAQARIAALNAGEDVRAQRLVLEREVRSALIDLENAYRAVQLAHRGRELARKQIELANQQFRLGALKFTELQTLTERAAAAERDAVNARYDFAAAHATLEERVGAPVDSLRAR